MCIRPSSHVCVVGIFLHCISMKMYAFVEWRVEVDNSGVCFFIYYEKKSSNTLHEYHQAVIVAPKYDYNNMSVNI